MNGSVILIEQTVPEKHLSKKTTYKYILSSSMINQVVDDFKRNVNMNFTPEMTIEVDVKVVVREYDNKVGSKNFYYDKK